METSNRRIPIWHVFMQTRGEFAAEFLGTVAARNMADATEIAKFLWGNIEQNPQIVPTWRNTGNYKDIAA